MNLSGTVVPMATPTHGNQRAVDIDSLKTFTRQLVDAGVHGLFPGSSIGEFPSLTTEQNRQVVEAVTAAAGDDVTVMAGCCDTDVDTVVENIEAADRAGADAGVVVSPYYLGTTQSGLSRFFRSIADQSSLPLLLYNIPQLTGNALSIDLVTELAEHSAIAGLKDTSGDLNYHYRAVEETPDDFAVFQGATQLATASLDVGSDGLIAGPANVFPAEMAALYEAHASGDLARAQALMQDVVAPFVSATSDVPTAAAMKHLLELDGLAVGDPLPPLPELTNAERQALAEAYRTVGAAIDEPTVER